jgi:hypothetical protein
MSILSQLETLKEQFYKISTSTYPGQELRLLLPEEEKGQIGHRFLYTEDLYDETGHKVITRPIGLRLDEQDLDFIIMAVKIAEAMQPLISDTTRQVIKRKSDIDE